MQEAVQERKIHEKMREKAFERFIAEMNAAEVKEIDELTSYVYGTKDPVDDEWFVTGIAQRLWARIPSETQSGSE